jgi:hypothetical protein
VPALGSCGQELGSGNEQHGGAPLAILYRYRISIPLQ